MPWWVINDPMARPVHRGVLQASAETITDPAGRSSGYTFVGYHLQQEVRSLFQPLVFTTPKAHLKIPKPRRWLSPPCNMQIYSWHFNSKVNLWFCFVWNHILFSNFPQNLPQIKQFSDSGAELLYHFKKAFFDVVFLSSFCFLFFFLT